MSDPHFREAICFIAGFACGCVFLIAAVMLGMWLEGRLEGIDEDTI